MSGVLCVIVSGRSGLSYNGTVTVGTSTISGKGFAETQHGYGDSTVAVQGVTFGSRSPTTTSGFTIIGIYWVTSSPATSNTTSLILTGDASAYSASMTVGGVNQNLGAGAFSGGKTTFTSTGVIASPFGADGSTSAVVIS